MLIENKVYIKDDKKLVFLWDKDWGVGKKSTFLSYSNKDGEESMWLISFPAENVVEKEGVIEAKRDRGNSCTMISKHFKETFYRFKKIYDIANEEYLVERN